LKAYILSGVVALSALLITQEQSAAGPHATWLRTTASTRPSATMMPTSPTDDPFDQQTLGAPEGALWTKWRRVQADAARDLELAAECRAELADCYSAPALRFIELVEGAKARSGRDRLDQVNQAINAAIRYTTDLSQHGAIDLWSSPLASLASGRGDCEDYAIAKYFVLRAAGIAANDLRMVLVRDLDTREYHAVVAVRQDAGWLVLDNRRMTLLDSEAVQRLQPLFAVNDQGVQMFAVGYAGGSQIAPATER
jgi:predicted transglutaminase-like cysteine proteinase